MEQIDIKGYLPGAIGRITEMHAVYYSRNWNFGIFFERKVATELSEFLGRMDPSRDGIWIACVNQRIIGSIVIDGSQDESKGAHLRWFIVDPDFHGRSIGSRLIGEAMAFCRKCGFRKVYLWTFSGLDPARHLYERNGFRLSREETASQWGVVVREQLFETLLKQ